MINNSLTDPGDILLVKLHFRWSIVGEITPTKSLADTTLESAGLIESTVALDADGHHRKQFHLVVDSANLTFDSSGIEITDLS